MNKDNARPAESKLVQSLSTGRFALTAEVVPPVSGLATDLLARAAPLRDMVDAVNVTDGARASVTMSSLAASGILAANGIQPVLQMTCRDRNRIALLSDLLGASALGVNNVLIMRGDDPSAGPYPDAKPVFDVESGELIRWASTLAGQGVLPSGGDDAPQAPEVVNAPRLFIGAADSPLDPPAGWRPEGLQHKIAAGAQFVQTQLCYDIEMVRRYIARLTEFGLPERIHILIGTGPLASARSARWMNEHLWGVNVPDEMIARLDAASDPKREGVALCIAFLEQLSEIDGVAGAHLMAPGNAASLPEVIDGAKLGRA